MKRIHILACTLALALPLAACGSPATAETEPTTESTTETTQQAPADETAKASLSHPTGVINVGPGQSLPTPVDVPVVIDLYATWCGPCRQYGPIFDRVASDYAGKAIFVRVDVDERPDIAERFNVNAIPTTVILKPGASPKILTGLLSYEELTSNL